MADQAPTTRIVVTPNPIGVGQSVVPPGTPGSGSGATTNQAYDIAALTPNGPNPAAALDGTNPANIAKLLRFPSDTPPYYMQLAINDYHRQDWRSVGKLNETGRIILPIPNMLVDSHNVRYEISDIGIAGGVGFDAIGGSAAATAKLAAIGAGLTLAEATATAAAGAFGAAGAAVLASGSKAFNGALGAAGLAQNQFLTIMLKGPDYKRRDFIWKFSPKTPKETYDLRRIIQLINNSMAPSFSPTFGSAFFNWPCIWKPEFVYNGINNLLALNTFKMRPSVVTDFSVNYSPNGVFSPFAATKAPTSVEMRMTFLELEFWLKNDFDDLANLDEAGQVQAGIQPV